MRFPFVTSAHHEEVVSLLRDRLEGLEREKSVLLDRLLLVTTGQPAEVAQTSLAQEPLPLEPAPELSQVADVIKRKGYRSPMQVAREIERANAREYVYRNTNRAVAAADSIDEAFSEGEQASAS